MAQEVYNLRPKDGKVHVLYAKVEQSEFKAELGRKKLTSQINWIIEGMQDKGYEIVDIKESKYLYTILIIYK